MSTSPKKHWEQAYTAKAPEEVSWFEESPETSLSLIDQADLGADAAILDVGGGASHLAGELRRRGYGDVTVADISRPAPGGGAACASSRYDAEGLALLLGEEFQLHSSELHLHGTPSGSSQQFQYALFQRRARGTELNQGTDHDEGE